MTSLPELVKTSATVGTAGGCPAAAARHAIASDRPFHGHGALRKADEADMAAAADSLAIAAVADPDIERLAVGLEPDRAAQASALPRHHASLSIRGAPA